MVHEMKGFVTITADEIPWVEDKLLALPKGVKSKVLSIDKSRNAMDLEVKFPTGYVEPRHTHNSSHSGVVLEGKMLMEGKTPTRGGYFYAEPNIEHDPMSTQRAV